MNRTMMALLAATTLAAGVPAVASAQDWGVNQRQAQLDQRIDVGLRSGQLTQAEAARLRAEFQNIAYLERRYRTNGLSRAERADLDRRFDALSANIREERWDRQAERPGSGDWDINQRQAQLDQRIDVGLRNGQLTQAEAARLRAEFQEIERLERRYRYNGLSAAERADLDQRFDALSASIRDERRDWQAERPGSGEWQNINQRQAQLDQRIDVGLRNGQLTPAEAARLRAEFQEIARLERRYRQNGLSAAERADLDQRFDALSASIRDERRDWQAERPGSGEWQNINQRQAQLDRRIDVGLRNGQLTQAEAARLRAEFQSIARLERRYRQNGLSPAERADLDRRFDQLSDEIRDERRDRQADRWENLNQRQSQFEQRLNRAVQDRRLDSRQAMNLRMEFDTIARLEQRYRQDGLSRGERADLDMRFDRLQANFRASVNASSYGHGYGEAPNLFDYLFGNR